MVTATALTLGAALVHVVWNTLVKQSEGRDLVFLGQFAFGSLLFLSVVVVVVLPGRSGSC